MQKAIKLTDGWVVCGKCGHKLTRTNGEGGSAVWSFKCMSCKEINEYGENEAGYRKADEVRKETAKEIKDFVSSFLQEVIFDEQIPNEISSRLVWNFEKLKKHIDKKYGIEVDE